MIEKTSAAAAYGGGGVAVYFGLTPGEWQIVGIIGGLAVGVLGLVINACVTWHFKSKHYRLAERRALGVDE